MLTVYGIVMPIQQVAAPRKGFQLRGSFRIALASSQSHGGSCSSERLQQNVSLWLTLYTVLNTGYQRMCVTVITQRR